MARFYETLRVAPGIVLMTMLGMAILLTQLVLFASREPQPFVVQKVESVTPEVRAGETATIRYTVDRNRVCPAMVFGWWVKKDTNEAVVRFPPETGGYSQVGKGIHVNVRRQAPFEVGVFCYRYARLDMCDNGQYSTNGPEACVEVR